MDEYTLERLLAWFYPLIAAFSLVATVTFAVAWNHWKYVLDTCDPRLFCGCIFNARSTPTYFVGSHVAYCYWATVGPLLGAAVAVFFGTYHVWRVCMGKGRSRTGTTTVKQRSGDVIVMTTRTELTDDSISPYWWVPSSIAACFMTLYTLTHAAMALDGFLYACRQYRIELTKYMRATGPLVESIQGRISCAAVFDFMDYIHPDVSYDRRRIDRINTPAALITGLIASWLCFVLWASIAYIAIRQARQSRRVRV
ncbi:uncharacterized protein LOC132262357 [Phlebotomus argentipes]|uniref:uncharacterized protein LOC132262357 n=1 Tax=Phlebotomus argentipes TaxID=94469 RepID=UPI002892B151|nr:uncharacterized protein LOC132262357 [Phlebotomus argentipes]